MKPRQFFPNNFETTPEGIVAVGGNLTTGLILEAYGRGIFPWPHEDLPMLWFSPDPRGVLFFDELKISSSLKKRLRKKLWTYTVNKAFPQVIENCKLAPRKGQNGTWINDSIVKAYKKLNDSGHIVSVEVWNNTDLVGGIYAVKSKNYLSAESMFFKETDAGKAAFVKLVQVLKQQNHTWMDLQMVTNVSRSFGGREIPRKQFLEMIKSNPV